MKQITIGILAHVDAGKTTLSEGILYKAGSLRRAGRVDRGDAFFDTHELERQRGITIFSKQTEFVFRDCRFTLLDTPGHVDFSAEMERTLQVLDYAILVVSGADGVQSHTRTLWQLLARYDVPVFLFVNKMDQPGTDKTLRMEELVRELGSGCVDFSDGEGEAFREEISLCDEEVLESYLETGEIREEDIRDLIWARKLFPCYFGSALRMEGVEELLDGLALYGDERWYPSESEMTERGLPGYGARVFKIARDEQSCRLTYVKVTAGVMRPRMVVEDAGGEWQEKVNQIRLYRGEKYDLLEEAGPGSVCVLTGLTRTYPGEGLGGEPSGDKPVLTPVLTYRIRLPESVEASVMLPKLRQLEDEEPLLHILWDENLQEIQAQVMGEVQIEILKSLIGKRFGLEVSFGRGNIVYRETIGNTVEGVGHFEPLRHYAEVHLLMEPGAPGSGITVGSLCSEDVLDKNWQRLILTHVLEREHPGVLTGAGLTDVKISLTAGRAHLKHTEGGDFRQATYRAIRQGLMEAESVLLEPFYKFSLEVPEEVIGHAMADVERMGGHFEVEQDGRGMSRLTGKCPVATMRDYAREVAAYARGQGKLSCVLSGYEPCHNTAEVLQETGYDPEKDAENPTGSIFCSHGAGYYVPWDRVKEHMHLPGMPDSSDDRPVEETGQRPEEGAAWVEVEEIDRILDRATNANKKHHPVSRRKRRLRALAAKPAGRSGSRKKQEKRDKYLLVDGYNIIFAWEELKDLAKTNIDGARGRLMDILCNYQGFKKCHLILVFDAYRVQNHPTEIRDYHNIHVVYTREAETADQYIEKFAHEHGKKHNVTVATSDGLEQIIIRGEGCRRLSARDLLREIRDAEKEMRELLNG